MELLDISGRDWQTVFLRGYATNDTMNIIEYVDTLPKDPYFNYLFACIFGLTCIKADVRLEINDENEAAFLYVIVKACPCSSIINTCQTAIPLFIQTAGRQTNEIVSFSKPFNTGALIDVANETKSTTRLHGIIKTSLTQVLGMPDNERYMSSYGADIDLAIGNYGEVTDDFPTYAISLHEEIFTKEVWPAIEECMDEIRKRLDPAGFMKIVFHTTFSYGGRTAAVSCINIKAMISIKEINGIQVYNLTNTNMIFRPVKPGMTFGEFTKVDWNDAKTFITQIATALYSDANTLFIPDISSFDTVYIDGKQWLKVTFEPHFCHFTKNQIFYGNADIAERYAQDFFWLTAGIGSFIQFAFPTVNEVPDPAVLCYGRVMKQFLKESINTFSYILTCDEIKVRVVAEQEAWVYFALIDSSVEHTLTTFLHFNEYFLANIGGDIHSDLTGVLDTLVGSFCASDPDRIMSVLPDKLWQSRLKKANGDELVAIINFWETAIQMDKRKFAPLYYKVRDAILDNIRKANDQLIQSKTLNPELQAALSPTQMGKMMIKFNTPVKAPVKKQLPPLKRLFGKDK